MTVMSGSTMILRRRCVAVDDDEIRIDVTDDDDRTTTTVLGRMMTMLSEGDEGRGSRIERFGSVLFYCRQAKVLKFHPSRVLFTTSHHGRFSWAPASCTSSNGFLSSLLGRS